jgi:hypothetical protein
LRFVLLKVKKRTPQKGEEFLLNFDFPSFSGSDGFPYILEPAKIVSYKPRFLFVNLAVEESRSFIHT